MAFRRSFSRLKRGTQLFGNGKFPAPSSTAKRRPIFFPLKRVMRPGLSVDWTQRVSLLAAAFVAGVARLPKTRVSEAQRIELRSAVSRTADVLRAAAPRTLAPLKPIFVRTDSEGKATGVNFDAEDQTLAGSGFLIAPEDAGKYEDVQLWPARILAQPFKLYRRDGEHTGLALPRGVVRSGRRGC